MGYFVNGSIEIYIANNKFINGCYILMQLGNELGPTI